MSIKLKLEDKYRSLVGSLNWLTTGTRTDIGTITNMLSAYIHNVTHSYLSAVKYVIKYLKGTSDFEGFKTPTDERKYSERIISRWSNNISLYQWYIKHIRHVHKRIKHIAHFQACRDIVMISESKLFT